MAEIETSAASAPAEQKEEIDDFTAKAMNELAEAEKELGDAKSAEQWANDKMSKLEGEIMQLRASVEAKYFVDSPKKGLFMQTKFLVAVLTALVALAGCAQPRTQVQSSKDDLPSLEQQAKATPANGDLQFRLGQEYMRYGKYTEAAEAFKKSYGGYSPIGETWSWHWAAFAYEKAGKNEAAVSALKRSIELNPSHADNYVFLARLHYNKAQYDDAITAAKQAISLQPTLWTAYNFLGASYGKKKQYQEAIASLRRASELAPKEAGNFTWMGDLYQEQDLFAEAISAYMKASELAPENVLAQTGVAVSYYFMASE